MPIRTIYGSYLDVSAWDGVDPLGVNDSAAGLAAALAYGASQGFCCWLPDGAVILTSQPLQMMQPWVPPNGRSNQTFIGCWNLVGRATGVWPKIKVPAGFAPSTGPQKAVIHGGMYGTTTGTTEKPDWSYGGTVRRIQVEINGSNNANAIGIHVSGAQWWQVRQVRVEALGAALYGFCDGAGPGGHNYDVEIVGPFARSLVGYNQLGTHAGQALIYRKFRIDGGTEHSVSLSIYRGVKMVGFEIVNAPPSAIRAGLFDQAPNGHVVMSDSKISWATPGGTLVKNDNSDKVVVLRNVYVDGCAKIVEATGSANDIAGSPGVIQRLDGVYLPPTSYTTSTGATGVVTTVAQMINGAVTAAPVKAITATTVGSIPANLIARHAMSDLADLDPTVPGVIDAVAEYGAAPENAAFESHVRIQAAIDAAHAQPIGPKAVFLRKGTYYGSVGIERKGDVVVFGPPTRYARLFANASWLSGMTERHWMLRDDADVYGAGGYYDLVVDFPNSWGAAASGNWLGCLEHRQGPSSFTHSLRWLTSAAVGETRARHVFRFAGPNAQLGRAGNAGGDHIDITDIAQLYPELNSVKASGYRKCYIDGVDQPLRLGALNLEHGGASFGNPNHPFLEIVDSEKIEIESSKWETHGNPIIITNSKVLLDYVGIWSSGDTQDSSTPAMVVNSPSEVEVGWLFRPPTAVGAYGTLISEIGYASTGVISRNQIAGYYRRGSAFDREAMFVTLTRPAPPGSGADVAAAASTVWYLYLEGLDPAITDLAVAEVEAAEAVNGTNIMSTATVTVGAGGSGAGNLKDGSAASDMTATAAVAVKLEWAAAKALRELRVKAPASAAPPVGLEIWREGADGRILRMIHVRWATFAAGETKVIRLNRRGAKYDMSARARAKIAALS